LPVSSAALPDGRTRRWCGSGSPLLSRRGPMRGTRVLSAASSALRGAACNTKGVCGCECAGGFPGPPASPSWPSPPYTHPFGALSPSRMSTTLGAGPGCSLKLPLLTAAAAAAEGGDGKTLGAVLGLEHPHTAASPGIPPVRRRPPIISQPRQPDWFHPGYATPRNQSGSTNNRWIAQPTSPIPVLLVSLHPHSGQGPEEGG
jgi:hypothetical protein